MTAIRINEAELEIMGAGSETPRISATARLTYLLAIRPYMDFKTGMVGIRRMVTYQSIKETIEDVPPQGSTRKQDRLSKQRIRALLEELVRYGLIEWNKTEERGLIFFCPLADTDESVLDKSNPRATPEQPQKSNPSQVHRKASKSNILTDDCEAMNNPSATYKQTPKSNPPPESGIRQSQSQRTSGVNTHSSSSLVSGDQKNSILCVFSHWKKVMHKSNAVLDDVRQRAIDNRLTEGFTVQDLCDAIDGCFQSEWHQGENDRGRKFDDIELICRDTQHVEQFLTLARQVQTKGTAKWGAYLDDEKVINGECYRGN